MKKILIYICGILFLGMNCISCVKETICTTFQKGEGKTLRLILNSPELTTSRAMSRAEAGIKEYNENYIDYVHCFFYPAKDNDEKTDDNAIDATFMSEKISVGKHYESTPISIELSIPMDKCKDLLPSENSTCRIYVIANLPADVTIGKTSINALKKLEVTAEGFAAEGVINDETKAIEIAPQARFVMDGLSTVSQESDNKLSGQVPLTRSAAKIALFVNSIKGTIVDANKETWKSDPNGMRIRIHNGVINGYIDGNGTYPERNYYTSNYGATTRTFTTGNNGYEHVPFYSYPSEWSENGDNETYLSLVVPWKKTKDANGNAITTTEFEDCFYQIPINVEERKILRNTYHKIYLSVGMLGSFTPDEPVLLAPSSYIVVDWGTGGVSASFEKFSYLIVDQLTKVYNKNSVTIPFVSSHEAEITAFSISQPNLSDGSTRNTEDILEDEKAPSYSIDNDAKTITYSKDLINKFTDANFDFTPYTITFTLKHTDASGGGLSQKDVTIIQYPAIYGEADENSDYSENYNNKTGINGNNGFAFVNGYQGSPSDGVDNFCGIDGLDENDDDLTASSMYVFTITSTEGTNYVIGDPRDTDITYNANSANWANAPSIASTTKRELENYYGTDESYRTKNMIAPKFRVVSAYGAITSSQGNRRYKEYVKKRCASYQEDGYPAGRWRLPTQAEFEFINYLSNNDKIPTLYVKTMDYWCAHGYGKGGGTITDSDDYGNSSGVSVRCVYDDWYWGSTPALTTLAEKNVFTWGDKLR